MIFQSQETITPKLKLVIMSSLSLEVSWKDQELINAIDAKRLVQPSNGHASIMAEKFHKRELLTPWSTIKENATYMEVKMMIIIN